MRLQWRTQLTIVTSEEKKKNAELNFIYTLYLPKDFRALHYLHAVPEKQSSHGAILKNDATK